MIGMCSHLSVSDKFEILSKEKFSKEKSKGHDDYIFYYYNFGYIHGIACTAFGYLITMAIHIRQKDLPTNDKPLNGYFDVQSIVYSSRSSECDLRRYFCYL